MTFIAHLGSSFSSFFFFFDSVSSSFFLCGDQAAWFNTSLAGFHIPFYFYRFFFTCEICVVIEIFHEILNLNKEKLVKNSSG